MDGVARPRSATNARALFGTHHAEPGRPSAAIGARRTRCSIFGTMRERGDDGARQRRRRHQDIPVGSSRSASPHIRSQRPSTAPDSFDRSRLFRITHVFHPLYGREFTLVERRSVWGEERVYFYDDHGALRRLPAAWTSVALADAFVEISAGRSHFRIEDLLHLTVLIAQLREARTPKRRSPRGRQV
jgi:hypothetical protein